MPMPTIISDKEDVKVALRAIVTDLDLVYGTVSTMAHEGAEIPKGCADPVKAVERLAEDLEDLIERLDYAFASFALDALVGWQKRNGA